MDYKQTLEFLYMRLAAFHRIGQAAYKPGLETSLKLSNAFGAPHKQLRAIHIGGTNGKGSTAHTVAAILTAAGYKTGLYTSPHLMDFSERIRIDGVAISHDAVEDFVERFKNMDVDCDPSFFELATIMAFEYFVDNNVDYSVVEVGLGGRLDSTNIITPQVAAVTNVSKDHTAILGDTIDKIAYEKAGIFKAGIPSVVGESNPLYDDIFRQSKADDIVFADKTGEVVSYQQLPFKIIYQTRTFGAIEAELCGDCQVKNTGTILEIVKKLRAEGAIIADAAVRKGFAQVCALTGLMGRWQKLSDNPTVICDTGHNPGAWQYLGPRLATVKGTKHIVLGFVDDKDIRHIMDYLPVDAYYYFVQPSTPRAARAQTVAAIAADHGIHGTAYNTVFDGYAAALQNASVTPNPFIFVGGSTFVVSDLMTFEAHVS